ncbi:MAG TPA: hypothetical protein VNS79_07940 [Sphingobium sp.]|nr:hypothetical protein [Sphingobium sp.]
MKTMFLALMLLPLTACVQSAGGEPQLGAREARDLARALDGKVPGEPVSCVTALRSDDLRALGDNTLIFRVNKDLVYRNTLNGACNGLSMGDTLVMRRVTSQYCRGDIATVVNLPSGAQTGSCSLGDFVPYMTPK